MIHYSDLFAHMTRYPDMTVSRIAPSMLQVIHIPTMRLTYISLATLQGFWNALEAFSQSCIYTIQENQNR